MIRPVDGSELQVELELHEAHGLVIKGDRTVDMTLKVTFTERAIIEAASDSALQKAIGAAFLQIGLKALETADIEERICPEEKKNA